MNKSRITKGIMEMIGKGSFLLLLLVFATALGSCQPEEKEVILVKYEPVQVSKTNSTKLYMHYMPWFQGKEFSGIWGSHWRMANKNPDVMEGDKRQIAAHYYPLIGPYDSEDPDVIEYHLLLMKYSGIDGVLIDWYGSHKANDYYSNLVSTNALIDQLDTIGLDFGIVYEEYTAEIAGKRRGMTAVEAAQADMIYLEENYYVNDRYIRINENPLLLTFGPRYFQKASQWTEIFSIAQELPAFLPLWNHTYRVGNSNSDGEFAWIDFNYNMSELNGFYSKTNNEITIGSAFAGFHDYYKEGGWGESYGYLSHLGGETLSNTLKKAAEFNLPYVQLATWNDFGEGTMIEPTDEFQFQFLEIIQEFSGVSYGKSELELIHDFYLKRKEYTDNPEAQIKLDAVFISLNNLKVEEARNQLNNL